MSKLTIRWLAAAGTRAIKTVAQTAVGMITIGAAISDIKWGYVISVSAVSGLLSLLTSIATNLPEVSTNADDPNKYLAEGEQK